jgi:hypothetical protein
MEQNQLMLLKWIRKERVGDILAADPALYRLNGRYLCDPGLISRALAMAIEATCALQPILGDNFSN